MSGFVEIDLNPPERILRQFGYVAFMAFGALAFMAQREVAVFRGGLGEYRELVAGALAGLGVLSGLFSLIAPRANRPLFVGLSVAAFPLGFVLSHVILAVLFFLLIAPMAFVMRALGRDVLARRSNERQSTYWVKARPARPVRDYFRQY